jgi:threonine/homoserine/homoserine lactone efflux protein
MPSAVAGVASPVVVAIGIGLAIASAPGPVQALVVVETARGGLAAGARAIAGACASFGALLVLVAFGLSFAAPGSDVARVLQAAGGLVLLWFAYDGFRSASADNVDTADLASDDRSGRRVPAAAQVALAVLVFPGTWIFLAAMGAPLIASARADGGPVLGLGVAVGLVAGSAIGNLLIALLVGSARRLASPALLRHVRQALAVALAAIGVLLIASAVMSGR